MFTTPTVAPLRLPTSDVYLIKGVGYYWHDASAEGKPKRKSSSRPPMKATILAQETSPQ